MHDKCYRIVINYKYYRYAKALLQISIKKRTEQQQQQNKHIWSDVFFSLDICSRRDRYFSAS